MPVSSAPSWLARLFWIVAVVTLLLIVVPAIKTANHPSGEFAGVLVLFEALLAIALAIVILIVALVRRTVAYWIGLALLSLPFLGFGLVTLMDAIEQAMR